VVKEGRGGGGGGGGGWGGGVVLGEDPLILLPNKNPVPAMGKRSQGNPPETSVRGEVAYISK